MGGTGSGRRCTDEYLRLDVRRLKREGLLEPGSVFALESPRDGETLASVEVPADGDRRLVLIQRHREGDGESKERCYAVRLKWTPCTYGGERVWFLCPSVGCGRRVAILYVGPIFACRHCYRLIYRTQRQEDYERLDWKAHFRAAEGQA
jgi:hypothetical protein